MSARTPRQGRTYRVNLRLDPEGDADLIAWLEGFPNGQRSAAIRTALRQAIAAERQHPAQGNSALDLEAIRSVVAEEIERALVTRHISAGPRPAQVEEDDLEARFGSRLDRMMGGLMTGG